MQNAIQAALDDLGVPARAVVIPTRWDVGPVAAFLFPDDPVTFVDSGTDTPEGRAALTQALADAGREPRDVKRVILTHGHTDHFGGSVWLQNESGCEVLAHPADIAVMSSSWRSDLRELFGPLGYTQELLDRYFTGEWNFETPTFSPLGDGDVIDVGSTRLRIDHRPGHTPGHIWVTDEPSGAIFVGDYLIADHPTNAGLEIDRTNPTGRAPLLQRYTEGLRELAERDAPALFPAHGPPITDHGPLIERRLHKSDRRTERILRALGEPTSAFDLATRLYRSRAAGSWEVMADLTGRLDLLVVQGRADARLGEDGVWYFRKTKA